MADLLIQRPSGHIYVATDILRKRKDMWPYEPAEVKQEEPEVQAQLEPETVQEPKKGLDDMTRDELVAEAQKTLGWTPSHKAKDDTIRNRLKEQA